MDNAPGRTKIEVKRQIIGPPVPRPRTVVTRKVGAYPSVPKAHMDVAKKLSSPMMIGPPICDELVAFVQHTFTEDEARVVRRLDLYRARSAAEVARAEGCDVATAESHLNRVAFAKYAIAGEGPEHQRKYRLLPIMPGIFEMVLIGQTPDSLTGWHRRFAELFEELYETGYALDYSRYRTSVIRYVPVGQTVSAHPMALPSDKMEAVLDRYDSFAVGHCQCRMSMRVTGRDCGKPLQNCTLMGGWAESLRQSLNLKRVSRQDIREIKAEAESHGLVSFVANVEVAKDNACCSCCGCCCHAMRMVREFNAPGAMAPPHFTPSFDDRKCTYCGRCAKACPMGALVVDPGGKARWQLKPRCIGCGLCAVACDKARAVSMTPVPGYQRPPEGWFGFLVRSAPSILRNTMYAWWRH